MGPGTLRALAVAAIAMILPRISGAESVRVATAPGSGIEITVERPFNAYSGYAPLTIEIANGSTAERTWQFNFESYSSSVSTRASETLLSVPEGERRRFELAVPLATPPPELSSLQMMVLGPGIDFGVSYPLNNFYDSPVGVDKGLSQRVADWKESPWELPETPTRFDPKLLPGDWRGFSSFTSIWMSEDDWRELRPGVGLAMREWVALGGHLVMVGSAVGAAALELPAGSPSARLGFGWVSLLDEPGETPAAAALAPPRWNGRDEVKWVSSSVGEIEQRSGMLGLFCLSYALLIGPVNLFVFTKKRRGRLFWTTPLTALLASLCLVALILLQEGLGGNGARVTAIHLMPELAREVVLQDQGARTGALLSSRFEVGPKTAIYDITDVNHYPPRRVQSRGALHFGDWFQSRSVRLQSLSAVRASRARVERVDGGVDAATSPVVVSSLDVTLGEIYYRDGDGLCWRSRDLHPGSPKPLERTSEEALAKFRKSMFDPGGVRIRALVESLASERNFFYAVASSQAPARALPTLDAIDWQQLQSIYLGPIGGAR